MQDDFDFDTEDTDNVVQIELTDEDFLYLAKMAHSEDITFNQLVNKALAEYLESVKDY
jgi:hypothetical protein